MFWKLIKGKKPKCSQNDFIDKIIDEIGNLRLKNNNLKISYSEEKSTILKTLNNSYYNSKNESLLEVIDLLEKYRVK